MVNSVIKGKGSLNVVACCDVRTVTETIVYWTLCNTPGDIGHPWWIPIAFSDVNTEIWQ